MSRIGKSIEMESRLVVTLSLEGWEIGELLAKGYGVSFGGDKNVLELVVIMEQFCEYTKNHQNVHFQRVNCIVCDLYLNEALTKKR